ncbi:MAG: hypothetical protein KatS3mg060_1380 [Dehalococcoidia bacterium]|nr:MAG: hypothetical protein KatS3mg060_1380 [Dehalococcoidia bacterium]
MGRVARYLEDAEASFAALCEVIERSDPAVWNEAEAAGEWSLRQLAAHVSANTRFHAEHIWAFVEGRPRATASDWIAERDAALEAGPAATVAWMRADHAAHLPALRALTDDQLLMSGQTKLGELTVEYMLRRLSSHARQHTRQARRIRQTVEARARSAPPAPNSPVPPKQSQEKGGAMEKDPVCGMSVDPKTAAATAEYQGKTYYFCAPGCKKAFEREPEKYLKQ